MVIHIPIRYSIVTHLSEDGIQGASSFVPSLASFHDYPMKGVSPPPLNTTGVSSTRIAFGKSQTLAVGEVSRLQVPNSVFQPEFENETPSSSESPRESVLSDVKNDEQRDWYNETPSDHQEFNGGYHDYNDFDSDDAESSPESSLLEHSSTGKIEDDSIYVFFGYL